MVIVQVVQLLLVVRSQQINNLTVEQYSYAAALGAAHNVVDNTTLGGLRTDDNKWWGIASAPTTGMLYCTPRDAASVLMINPTTNMTDTTTLSGLGMGADKWQGIAFAPTTGMLYCAPFTAASVLIINPDTNTTDTTTLGGLGSSGYKWFGVSFAPPPTCCIVPLMTPTRC